MFGWNIFVEIKINFCVGDICKLLWEVCLLKEMIGFWDEVDMIGGDERKKCYFKVSWLYFL